MKYLTRFVAVLLTTSAGIAVLPSEGSAKGLFSRDWSLSQSERTQARAERRAKAQTARESRQADMSRSGLENHDHSEKGDNGGVAHDHSEKGDSGGSAHDHSEPGDTGGKVNDGLAEHDHSEKGDTGGVAHDHSEKGDDGGASHDHSEPGDQGSGT